MYCILIDHLQEGLILSETGCGKGYPQVWGPGLSDVFARVRYEPQHELRAAIAATGHNVEDVKNVIIGHLHLDHAEGGLGVRGWTNSWTEKMSRFGYMIRSFGLRFGR
ncbi:uncharacterized protein BKA55DRAFT_709784 [Fusarium redolens]|uniref:Metallo-beta-lactamase domain-containing protein n=1 Tax=Fusarium redolens TaxID=48865 RepID=A0A9P9G9S0_FUSRE|nr:uncharacterized protein BKA55DRAFT_709784 [Fusarium redolens]KAH7233874.1 hypothetical protein BKA55DRAFT_709784 [Fusarium redolens]